LGVWRRKETLVTISRSSDRDSRDPGRGETANTEALSSRLLEFWVTREYDQRPKVEREDLAMLSIAAHKKEEGHANEPGIWVPPMPKRKIR
jgi:hypothetical protein